MKTTKLHIVQPLFTECMKQVYINLSDSDLCRSSAMSTQVAVFKTAAASDLIIITNKFTQF